MTVDICCENVIRVSSGNFLMALFFPFFKKLHDLCISQPPVLLAQPCSKSFSGPKKKKMFHDLLYLISISFLILYVAKVVNIDNLRDLPLMHVFR